MISVIIPLYNKEKCIERTIKSVLKQTYSDFELLVIDDGSTDNSKNVVLSINDTRIKYFFKENGGVSSARNYGVHKATTKWIFFLDADDVLLDITLEKLVSCSKKYPNMDIVVGGLLLKDGVNEVRISASKMNVLKNPLKNWALWQIFPRTGNLLITKAAYLNLGGFDERISYNEDWGFILKMCAMYQMACIPDITMVYMDDFKTLSQKYAPIENDFCNYMSSLSIANPWVNYFIYRQYIWSYQRRLDMNDMEGATFLRNEMKRRFSFSDALRNKILIKYSSLYRKFSKH